MKILIVDASKAMRTFIARSLKSTDRYRRAVLLEAEDGRQGIAMVADEQPDLVLSDWDLPGLQGLEFLRALRSEDQTVAFGFVTSDSTPEMYDRAVNAGAQFLVSKPFPPEALACAVAAVVATRP